ncbi:MAG: helix-turn-helix domain-containing protein [Patescibacteria group bacterium]|nr:helix-turn-helix domain-containing protein [Patescibacteria group bacterium]
MTISLLTPKEVAKLLKLNTLTVYAYIRKGNLKAVKFGRNYRISTQDLNKFIESNKSY